MLVSGISHDRFCFETKYRNSPGNLDGCSNHSVYGNPLGQESKGRDNTLSPEDGDGDAYCVLHPSACHDRCRMHFTNSNVQAKGFCICKVGLMLSALLCHLCASDVLSNGVCTAACKARAHEASDAQIHIALCEVCLYRQTTRNSKLKCTTSASEQCAVACFDYCTHAADNPK